MKQFQYTIILIAMLSLGIINPIKAQIAEDSELFSTLKENDSLLFNLDFNRCDFNQFQKFTTDDLEFYHDKGGVLNSKEEFIKAMAEGICKKDNPFKSRRELIKNSLQVYPLYNNGNLYAAIQNGSHRFFEKFEGEEKAGSVAKFSHLWILEDNQWKIKRIYSFDHQ